VSFSNVVVVLFFFLLLLFGESTPTWCHAPPRRAPSFVFPTTTRAEVEGFSCCCCCGAAGAAAPATPAAAAPPPPAPSVAETAETENSEGRIVAAAHPSLPARIAAPNADGLSLPSSQKLSIADAETLVLFVDLRAASA